MLDSIRRRASSRIVVLELAWTTAQVFIARLFGQTAGFLTAVLLARVLAPEGFGVYSLTLVVATLLAQLPGPGLDMSAVRVSARYQTRDTARARETLLIAGLTKAAIGLVLALAGAALAQPIAVALFDHADVALALRCAALGAFALSMTEFMLATLQAGGRFGPMSLVSMATAALKLGPVVILQVAGALTLDNALIAFLAAAYAGLLLSVLVSWRLWVAPIRHGGDTLRELFAFSRWSVCATLLGSLTSNLDVLALNYLAGAAAAGVYSSGRTLTLPLAFAGGALGAVLLPRLSAQSERRRIARYVGQVTLYSAAATAIVVGGLIIAAPAIIRIVYGAGYAEAVAIFQVLTLAYGVQLITWPALTMEMVFDRPDVVAWVIGAVLCLTAIGYMLVVPLAGMLGAAWIFLAGAVLQFIAYLWILRTVRRPAGAGAVPSPLQLSEEV